MLPLRDGPVIRKNIIAKILFASCSAKISYHENFCIYGISLCMGAFSQQQVDFLPSKNNRCCIGYTATVSLLLLLWIQNYITLIEITDLLYIRSYVMAINWYCNIETCAIFNFWERLHIYKIIIGEWISILMQLVINLVYQTSRYQLIVNFTVGFKVVHWYAIWIEDIAM